MMGMITKEKIKEWKKEGKIIVSKATFNKSVEIDFLNPLPYLYKGIRYAQSDWLLTYGHDVFYELIP